MYSADIGPADFEDLTDLADLLGELNILTSLALGSTCE
jgi:hypothetical protein